MSSYELYKQEQALIAKHRSIFFSPREAFFEKFEEEVPDKTTTIYDVGCGRGHIVRRLREMGYPDATGVDVQNIEDCEVDDLVIANLWDLGNLPKKTVVFMARPSDGHWIHKSFNYAFEKGVEKIIYVGLVEHYDRDLEGWSPLLVATGVGDSNENMWIINKPQR